MSTLALGWQPSLFSGGSIGFDREFSALRRRELRAGAWVDHAAAWLAGSDELFAELLEAIEWRSRVVHMYDRKVQEPRLTASYTLDADGLPVPVIGEIGEALSQRYSVRFASVGFNLYRDGSDSVAWHGDRVARDLPEATVAIVSVGEPRTFRLRPKGGGASITYQLGRGDLLVMGGSCQRTWDHAVPKVRSAGPRISITFRHAYD